MNFRPARAQLPDFLVQTEVGAADLAAEIEQKMAQSAHAATAGAHQIDHRRPGGFVEEER